MINIAQYQRLLNQLQSYQAQLVAVTKQRPLSNIQALYELGQRHFAENRTPELAQKQLQMPSNCHWHFIGHLQSNKIKQIIPTVHLIHSIDSENLLHSINNYAQKQERTINCLLQVHIAQEENKQGFDTASLYHFLDSEIWKSYKYIHIVGLMGMASFTDNKQQIGKEFKQLRQIFDQLKSSHFANQNNFKELSMGMSGDYEIALAEGANIVRIGSLLFE